MGHRGGDSKLLVAAGKKKIIFKSAIAYLIVISAWGRGKLNLSRNGETIIAARRGQFVFLPKKGLHI